MNIEEQRKHKSFIQAHKNEDEVIARLETMDIEVKLDGGTPLNHAANYDRVKIVNYLIHRGANVNALFQDYTPLMSACEGENLEIVKLLLDANADISVKDNFGNTALWKAAFRENEAIVKLLLEKGADPFEEAANGKSIYKRVKIMERDGMVELFDQYLTKNKGLK